MASTGPLDTSQLNGIASSAVQGHPGQPKLKCIQFLESHFKHGGLSKKGYDVLYRMIEMTSAIGWEVHVIYSSKIQSTTSKLRIERYISCILEGCGLFIKNMKTATEKALRAAKALPIASETQSELNAKFDEWRKTSRGLHEPTGNDHCLFISMRSHFADAAYRRLAMINTCKASYELRETESRAVFALEALSELCRRAQKADSLVLDLDTKLRAAEMISSSNLLSGVPKAHNKASAAHAVVRELLKPAIYQPSSNVSASKTVMGASESFNLVEEEIVRRSHHFRAATVPEADYDVSASASSGLPNTANSFHFRTIGTRRKGTNVPRVFTGSFSQLESDLRKLKLDKSKSPESTNISSEQPVVRDFGATPSVSPGGGSSPMLLQRREALLSKDIEIQDRVINGELIQSRRPSTKVRAMTVDNRVGGIEAWLNQEPSGPKSPRIPGSAVRRGYLRHREKTL